MPPPLSLRFTARVVRGAGRGRRLGSPTLNLSLRHIPRLRHGIYACFVTWNRRKRTAAMHFGPRPVFHAGIACEVHVIDAMVRRPPQSVTIEVVKRLRDVKSFPSTKALQKQISLDIAQARAILKLP